MVEVFYLNYLGCHSSFAEVDNLFLEPSLGLRYVNTISLAVDETINHIFAIIDGYSAGIDHLPILLFIFYIETKKGIIIKPCGYLRIMKCLLETVISVQLIRF